VGVDLLRRKDYNTTTKTVSLLLHTRGLRAEKTNCAIFDFSTPRKELVIVRASFEVRKVLGGVVLSIIWVLCYLLIKPTLYVDWLDNGSITTPLLLLVTVFGVLILFFYHIYYRSSTETTKLSWTACGTVVWLALIIFYPFKDVNNAASGAVAFFTLVGGLVVSILWVRFFSDEIIA
jgi:hypothetical protein